jgi:hypothetical protein
MREGPAATNRPHELAGQWMQSRRPTLRPGGRRRQRQRLEHIEVVSQISYLRNDVPTQAGNQPEMGVATV